MNHLIAKNNIEIYTDGSCLKNPGQGAWCYLIIDHTNKKTYTATEFEINTTNNQMEMKACLWALQKITQLNLLDHQINLYTDSQYLKNGINQWIFNWKKNNWLTSNKEPVKNQDLWNKIDCLNCKIKPNWHWVKAHSDNYFNNFVDEVAHLCATNLHIPDQKIISQIFTKCENHYIILKEYSHQ